MTRGCLQVVKFVELAVPVVYQAEKTQAVVQTVRAAQVQVDERKAEAKRTCRNTRLKFDRGADFGLLQVKARVEIEW
jgi:hypothetical protein